MINFKKALLSGTGLQVRDAVPLTVGMSSEVRTAVEYMERVRLDVHMATMVDTYSVDSAPIDVMREALYYHVYGEIECRLKKVRERIEANDTHTAYQLLTNLLENMEDTYK